MSNNENTQALKKIMHSAGIAFAFIIINSIFIFLFKVVSARFFGPENFGLFDFSKTIINFFSYVALFGIGVGITRYVPVYLSKKEYSKLNGYIFFVKAVPFI